jgi:hypothetical protein
MTAKRILFVLFFGILGMPIAAVGFLFGMVKVSFLTGMYHAEDLLDTTLERK